MSVVVTGAAGFIGGHLLRLLSSRRCAVTAIDRRALPAGTAALPGVVPVRAELTAADPRVRDALAGADCVLHLAGCPGVRDDGPDVAARRSRDNVAATAAVLAAVRPETPLLVASSSAVYGGTLDARPCAEDDPLRPRGGYAGSKARAEALCARRAAAGGHVLVVRPFTVAGPGQRPDMALARWIAAARAGRPLDLLGCASRTRDVTDVVDVARSLEALARRGASGTVNVGTGRAHTLTELADAVCAATGTRPPRRLLPAGDAEVLHTLACTRRLRSLIGFAPSTDLTALVARQVAAAEAGESPAGGTAAAVATVPSGGERTGTRAERRMLAVG